MTSRHRALIAAARRQHGEITPCDGKRSLAECFTHEPGVGLILWFNDANGNTRIVRERASVWETPTVVERATAGETPIARERAERGETTVAIERAVVDETTDRSERIIPGRGRFSSSFPCSAPDFKEEI